MTQTPGQEPEPLTPDDASTGPDFAAAWPQHDTPVTPPAPPPVPPPGAPGPSFQAPSYTTPGVTPPGGSGTPASGPQGVPSFQTATPLPPPTGGPPEPTGAGCYRHPGRITRITCRRCGRPICGECMVPAAVGFQCRSCVKADNRASRQNQGVYGGRRSHNPRTTSFVLIGVNAAVWMVIQATSFTGFGDRVVDFLGLSPTGICLVTGESNTYWGGVGQAECQAMANGTWMPGVADGAWWQVVTSIFTHVSILHIALNCLTLFFLGPALESLIGRTRFLATYFTAGLVGSLAVYWMAPLVSMSYGGSGSLFGLMGALLVLLYKRRMDVRQLLMWLGINVLITFVNLGSISWQAHLGGLVGGAAVACAWAFIPAGADRGRNQWMAVAGLVVLVIVGLMARTQMIA